MTTAHDAEPNPTGGQLSRRQWVRDVAIAGTVVAAGAGLAACSTSSPTSSGTAPAPAATQGTGPGTAPGTGAATAPKTGSGTAPTGKHGSAPGGESRAAPETANELGPEFVVAKTTTIPVGGGKVYPAHGVVVTQPTAGKYKCFNASCTHLGCTVNKVAAGLILCPCHGAKFSIVDGSVKAGPALRPLTVVEFSITDGEIVLG